MDQPTTRIISIIGGAVVALLSVIVPILFWMNKTMNQRFDDMNQRFQDLRTTMNQRFDDAQKANDLAHAHIGENIRSLERRIDTGLANVHTQLAAMTPRAMAAPPETGDTDTRP